MDTNLGKMLLWTGKDISNSPSLKEKHFYKETVLIYWLATLTVKMVVMKITTVLNAKTDISLTIIPAKVTYII